jgi:hypothetical protein
MSDRVVPAGAAPRLLRTAVFTAVCVVLAATGHALAACSPVPWWTLAAAFLVVFAVAAPMAGRTRSTVSIVVALTIGQLGLHTLFGLGQQNIMLPSGTSGDAMVGMAENLVCGAGPASISHLDALHILSNAGLNVTAADAQQQMVMGPATGHAMELLPSLPMTLAHLLAALATGSLLRRGDLALLRLGRLSTQGVGEVTDSAQLRALRSALALTVALIAGVPGPPAPAPRTPHNSPGAPPFPTGEALQHTVIRRGPPAAFALAA